MIYPWYDETRWLREVFLGDASHGTDLVRQYCPPGATAHFRTSYVSFRVNGLEYARMNPRGSIRRAIGITSWREGSVPPTRVVAVLSEAFDRIASDHDGLATSGTPLDWAKSLEPSTLADCMGHAIRHHQPEHWLESLLVAQPSLLCSGIRQARSQVVVGKQGDHGRKFIDVLGLDEPGQTLWVVEIKVPKANGTAIRQVGEYVDWVKSNLSEVMSPDNGYFVTSLSPADMKVGAMIVAPDFTSNIGDYAHEHLPGVNVRGLRVAAKWRSNISCEPCELPTRGPQRSRPILAAGAAEDCKPCAMVVTHGDIDGMVAAAIVIRKEGSADCEVAYSNARYISKKLHQTLGRESPPRRLYVCDIPSNADAYTAVNALNEMGVEVRWIDHHPWDGVTPEQMKRVCKEVIYHEGTCTPAGVLAGEWQGTRDAHCSRIGRICYAYERGTEWERNWFRLLASYVGKCRKDVLERLAFDYPFTEDDRRRIAEQERTETAAEVMLAQPPRTVTTAKGRSMAVYETLSKPGVYLGRKVFDRHEVSFCLVQVLPRKWQIACRPGEGLSLASLIGEHTVQEVLLRVGGREKQLLAIEVLADPPATVDLHEAVVDWASGKL